MNNTKYTKKVEWLRPFVESAKDLVPLKQITAVSGYRVKRGQIEQSYGSTVRQSKNKYSINIKIYDLTPNGKDYKGSHIYMILDTLAHELAHVKAGFDHTPEHYELTARIALKFSHILEKNGIIDTSMRVEND